MYPDGAAAAAPFFCTASDARQIKVLLDFFQKIAGVQGAAPPVARRNGRNTRAAHGAKHPSVPKRHPQMAQPPEAVHDGPMVPAAAPAGWTAGDICRPTKHERAIIRTSVPPYVPKTMVLYSSSTHNIRLPSTTP